MAQLWYNELVQETKKKRLSWAEDSSLWLYGLIHTGFGQQYRVRHKKHMDI